MNASRKTDNPFAPCNLLINKQNNHCNTSNENASKQPGRGQFGVQCYLCSLPIPNLPGEQYHALHLHIDHVVPRSKCGMGDPGNLKPTHRLCNQTKHCHTEVDQRRRAVFADSIIRAALKEPRFEKLFPKRTISAFLLREAEREAAAKRGAEHLAILDEARAIVGRHLGVGKIAKQSFTETMKLLAATIRGDFGECDDVARAGEVLKIALRNVSRA